MIEIQSKPTIHCPLCKTTTLIPGKRGKSTVDLDVCTQCHGIWFDEGKFENVFPIGAKEFRANDNLRPTPWRCPKCSRALRRTDYPQTDVEILICIDCDGVWSTADQVREIRSQRYVLKRSGALETHAPVIGHKGRWITYVNDTIDELQREYKRLRK